MVKKSVGGKPVVDKKKRFKNLGGYSKEDEELDKLLGDDE